MCKQTVLLQWDICSHTSILQGAHRSLESQGQNGSENSGETRKCPAPGEGGLILRAEPPTGAAASAPSGAPWPGGVHPHPYQGDLGNGRHGHFCLSLEVS